VAERPFAAAAERNAAPILDVLARELRSCSEVLEIGSGSGQHAVGFAAALPHLTWQPSDLRAHHAGIRAWIAHTGVSNVLDPLPLDVRSDRAKSGAFDAVFSSNTAHIMDIEAVASMFGRVADTLRAGGVFCLYGPFRIRGAFNAPSNAAFDQDLRSRDIGMGIRDIEELDSFGRRGGLRRTGLYAMPANNYIAVWRREDRT